MAKIKVYTLSELIKQVERARKIHDIWIRREIKAKKKGVRLSCYPGSVRWHSRWIDTYSALLNYLETSGRILGTDLKIKTLVK